MNTGFRKGNNLWYWRRERQVSLYLCLIPCIIIIFKSRQNQKPQFHMWLWIPPKSCMRNRKSVDNRRRETTGGKRRHVDLENVAWWTTTIFFVQNFLTRNKFYCAFETADKIESLFAYQDRLHLWIELKKQSPGCLYSDFIALQFSYSLLHQNPYISLFLRSKLARSEI